eukprot:6210874-Pleurochrysis_carterae.AAC.3
MEDATRKRLGLRPTNAVIFVLSAKESAEVLYLSTTHQHKTATAAPSRCWSCHVRNEINS